MTWDLGPVTCDLRPVTCDLRPVTCDLRSVTWDLRPATCDLWPGTCDLWPVTCVLYLPVVTWQNCHFRDIGQIRQHFLIFAIFLLRALLGISKSLVTTNTKFSEKQLSKLVFPDRHVSCTNLQSGEKPYFPDWHFSCPYLQNSEKFDSRELLTYCKFSFRCFDFVLLKKFYGK